ARELNLNMRDWWQPDPEFLSLIRATQVQTVAKESGALDHVHGIADGTKKHAVEELSRYFANASNGEDANDTGGRARKWLPGPFRFPAQSSLSTLPLTDV